VAVSDFITPHFYDPVATPGTRYSFTGAIKAPRELLKGGYISFINMETNEWEQILWVNPGPPTLNDLGPAPAGKSLRVWVDSKMADYRKETKYKRKLNTALMKFTEKHRETLSKIAAERAERYNQLD
jgi:hypothetical protein